MKICYTRLTQTIDLNPENIIQGMADERFEIFKRLIKRGHRIKIIVDLNNPTEKILEKVKNGEVKKVNGMDVTWLKSIEYDPLGMPSDEDVLMVEHGAVNLMFDSKHGEFLQLFKACEQIRNFDGLVLLLNADPDLPFPIHKFAGCKYDWNHKANPYRIETENNTWGNGKYNFKNYEGLEEYGWGNWTDLFTKDKTIVIVSKSIDYDKIMENKYGGKRGRHYIYHKKGLLNFESIPSAYDVEKINEFKFNKNPKYDVLYQGYPRNRERKYYELFSDMPRKLKFATTGNWTKTRKKRGLTNTNIRFLGKLKGLNIIPRICNNSRCVLQLAVKKSKKFDFVTNRQFEAVFSKTICLYDAEYGVMEKYLGKGMSLKNHEDAIQKYVAIRKMSAKQRFLIWNYQFQLCKNNNFDFYTTELEKICQKYGVNVKPKPYKEKKIVITAKMQKAVKNFVKKASRVDVGKYKTAKQIEGCERV